MDERFRLAIFMGAATLILTPTARSEDTTHDVIVVGAGSAGLYAAKTLIEDGYDVLIIEATDRIGGRVYSASLGDMRVELGAEEHYLETSDNPVYPAIVDAYGSSIYVDAYQGLMAFSLDGGTQTCWSTPAAPQTCARDSDVVLFYDFMTWFWRPNQHSDPTTSLADDVLQEYGVGAGDRGYHLYNSSLAGGSFATTLDRLGARSLALQSSLWDLSMSLRVLGDKDLGYSDALETIWWDDVVANSDLLLNSPVVEIDTRGNDVIVRDANQDRHAARQVIVTVSVGVLQAEMIDFVPDLPETTVSAYQGIGIDRGMKVPMRFSSAWWETQGEPLSWLVTEGVAGACWVPSDYKVDSIEHILLCYPMGDNAAALSSIGESAGGGAAGEAAIIDAILADLDRTFPRAPGAASANYIEGIVRDWGSHPYTLGAYSYPKVGTYTDFTESKRLELQVPVADNRVFFAGEATHHTHSATVVGALHEGERAAEMVHSINGIPNNPPPLPDESTPFVVLLVDDFEAGFGNWTDGGADANLYTGGIYANGNNAANLERNGSDATITTANLPLGNSSEIKVDFEFVAVGMEVDEYVQLAVSTDGGGTFQEVGRWTRFVDFANGDRNVETLTIDGVALTDQTQLRFRIYGNRKNDDVYIDDIRVSVR